MPRHRQSVEPIESALQGALDDTNFPVRSERHRDVGTKTTHAGNSVSLTPEERDRLATVPGERRAI